ncbi:hypothetical protein MKEN_01339400 [Mycena kentingensis (nom. inval.)]|nr:hypothetical protein MKEN_01339400 [Mycena kentingensis (nom. inval.)]
MSALQRPETPVSLHSWWSDSNSVGATIPLHILTKPLIRRLYHQQAMNLLEQINGEPLSGASMDALKPYLFYKEVGANTRAVVLERLIREYGEHPEETPPWLTGDVCDFAIAVVEDGAQTASFRLLAAACRLLACLAMMDEDARETLRQMGLAELLKPFIQHRNTTVQRAAWACYSSLTVDTLTGADRDAILRQVFWKGPLRRSPTLVVITTESATDFIRDDNTDSSSTASSSCWSDSSSWDPTCMDLIRPRVDEQDRYIQYAKFENEEDPKEDSAEFVGFKFMT